MFDSVWLVFIISHVKVLGGGIRMEDTKERLSFAVDVGSVMLSSGAEVYRVKETIMHILHGLDIYECDVYVLSNAIFASANEKQEDGCSVVRNIVSSDFHLGKISALNQLSRDIYNHRITLTAAMKRFDHIQKMPKAPQDHLLLACGLGAACFTFIFGGHIRDCFISFVNGMILAVFLYKIKGSRFIRNIFGSFIVSGVAMLSATLFPALHYNQIIIGTLMPLVPGIALTTGVRDLFYGDYLSGAIHMLDALLTGLCIAVGVGALVTLVKGVIL